MNVGTVVGVGAFIVFVGGFGVFSGWACFAMWQERRKGLHLHAITGVLHSHLDGHRPHIHPLSATTTGWRWIRASVFEAEIEHVDALDIHSPIPETDADDDPWWRPQGQR